MSDELPPSASADASSARRYARRESLVGAAVVVGLIVVAIGVGARGSANLSVHVDHETLGIGLFLAAFFAAGLAVATWWRRRSRRQVVPIALILFALALAVVASGVTAGWRGGGRPASLPPLAQPGPASGSTSLPSTPHPGSLAPVPIAGVTLIVVLVVMAAVAAVLAHRRRARADDDPAAPREAIYAAVDAGVHAMRDVADPRAAIIACYAAMERTLANAGVRRRISETPNDLLSHAAASGHAPRAAARLTELFLEARYSTHEMAEADRAAARAALERLRTPGGVTTPSEPVERGGRR